MNINILGTKVHVALVLFGTLCVLVLFGCVGVISWGGWKMTQQDEATKNQSEDTAKLESLTEELKNENEKSQEESKKLSSQMQNQNGKLKEEIEKLNQTIQLIQKYKDFLLNEHCNGKECLLCQKGWIFFNDSCYFLSDVSLNWDQSRAFCQLSSADLVVIDNQQEQEFIHDNMNKYTNYWLGLRSVGSNWVWIDGRVDTLMFWTPSDYYYYPNYSRYHYALMYQSGNPRQSWEVTSSSSTYRPVCELKAFKVSLN